MFADGVSGVGVGIPSSLYTATVKGGLYKQRKVIQQCCFGRGGEVVRGEMERCRRGAGEVLKRCWRGVGKLLDKC